MTHEFVTEVAPDIVQIRMPLPFALNAVNCYLLRAPDGWTLVDTGINTLQARERWLGVFRQLGIAPRNLDKVVLTHVHPDHFGLAGWLHDLVQGDDGRDLPVFMSRREFEFFPQFWEHSDAGPMVEHLRIGGVPDSIIGTIADSFAETLAMTYPRPPRFEALRDNEPVQLGRRTFQPIHAPGHSDGQLVFYDAADHLMLCGDHVLMKITPNIGLWMGTHPDPLGRFMHSLRELEAYEVRLALPGHKAIITDWRGRLRELLDHHGARLEHALDAVSEGCVTAYEVAYRIFETERFTAHEWRFAIAETLAHLEHLVVQGALLRHEGPVWTYEVSARG
jgi:glyoxylase-like metal-dependent hydrolase (beta-lactamase superfamily II)